MCITRWRRCADNPSRVRISTRNFRGGRLHCQYCTHVWNATVGLDGLYCKCQSERVQNKGNNYCISPLFAHLIFVGYFIWQKRRFIRAPAQSGMGGRWLSLVLVMQLVCLHTPMVGNPQPANKPTHRPLSIRLCQFNFRFGIYYEDFPYPVRKTIQIPAI